MEAKSTVTQASTTPASLSDVASQLQEEEGDEEEEAGRDEVAREPKMKVKEAEGKKQQRPPAVADARAWFRALKLEPRVDIHESAKAYVLQVRVGRHR